MNFPNMGGLQPFDAAKFGLFIHWGPVSQWGTEISFPLVCTGFPCTVMTAGNVPLVVSNASELSAHREAYAALAETFSPSAFNATLLADLAYNAGYRYVTYTSLHCDGFSGWNSTLNRAYSSVSTPLGLDITGEIVAAFRARGLRAGVYVCPSIWNSDAYWAPSALTAFGDCCSPNYNPLAGGNTSGTWGSFVSYLHGLVAELIDLYKPQHFWFDSGTYPPQIGASALGRCH